MNNQLSSPNNFNDDKENRILWTSESPRYTRRRPDYPEDYHIDSKFVSPRQTIQPEIKKRLDSIKPLRASNKRVLSAINEYDNQTRHASASLQVHRDPPSPDPDRTVSVSEEFESLERIPAMTRSSHNLEQDIPMPQLSKASSGLSSLSKQSKRLVPVNAVKFATDSRRFAEKVFKASEKLANHLGLGRTKLSKEQEKVKTWVQIQEQLCFGQICLVAPKNVEGPAYTAYADIRPEVLAFLQSDKHKKLPCGYTLFFSDFTCFSPLQEGLSGSCLFLMCDYPNLKEIDDAIQQMVRHHQLGKHLHVIVQEGTPKLYSPQGKNTPVAVSGKTYRKSPAPPAFKKPTKPRGKAGSEAVPKLSTKEPTVKTPPNKAKKPGKHKNGASPVQHDDTPENTPPEVIRTFSHTEPTEHKHWPGFHYGLRWITNMPIPGGDDGVLTKHKQRPDIGDSIGHLQDKYSCGTLGGYLVDEHGTHYVLSAYHVFTNGGPLHKPQKSDNLLSQVVVCPGNSDYISQRAVLSRHLQCLHKDLARAMSYGDVIGANDIRTKGRELTRTLEQYNSVRKPHSRKFGTIINSAWKMYDHPDKGAQLVDMTLIRPLPDRIGTNTFDYYGRDRPYARHFRLEARGWADPHLGDEVLKVGRTSGITKGHLIATAADIKVCTGMSENQNPSPCHFFEIKAHIVTNGSGPWFSEAGDSGAFILKSPNFDEMRQQQLENRNLYKKSIGPDAAPVMGLLFGGADSVEGLHLTFFSPSSLMKSYLYKMTGLDLVPGIYREDEDETSHEIGLRAILREIVYDDFNDPDHVEFTISDNHPFKKDIPTEVLMNDLVEQQTPRNSGKKKEIVVIEEDSEQEDEFASEEEHSPVPEALTPVTRRRRRRSKSPWPSTARTMSENGGDDGDDGEDNGGSSDQDGDDEEANESTEEPAPQPPKSIPPRLNPAPAQREAPPQHVLPKRSNQSTDMPCTISRQTSQVPALPRTRARTNIGIRKVKLLSSPSMGKASQTSRGFSTEFGKGKTGDSRDGSSSSIGSDFSYLVD